jgi:FixJ family two-component response regulator
MTVSIAIVDDDEDILDAIQLVLEDQGWGVQTYATGEDFLADLRSHKPDCLILDPHLLGLSGGEVARSVANGNDRIPIIGLTARPVSPLAIEVMNAGAGAMLTKPVTAETLIEHIQAAIGTSP